MTRLFQGTLTGAVLEAALMRRPPPLTTHAGLTAGAGGMARTAAAKPRA